MLDLTRLRALAAVARHGSVTAAAAELGYVQSSLSHHLARLEAETGTRLLQRAGRGVRLTAAGRMLAERAEEILGRVAAAEAELAAHSGLRAGRVRLAAFPSALGTFVPAATATFAAAHPGVELRFSEAEPPEAVRLLRSGEVDVAVVFEYADTPAGPQPGLRRTPLLSEPTALLTPAGSGPSGLAEHAASTWITGCERCRAHLLRQCAALGFSPRIAFTTDDYLAVQALVAAGLGVTTLPALALAAHTNPGVTATPVTGATRDVSALVYGDPPDPAPTAALLAALAAAALTAVPATPR